MYGDLGAATPPVEPAAEQEPLVQIGTRLKSSTWWRLHQYARWAGLDIQEVFDTALTELFDRHPEEADKPLPEKTQQKLLANKKRK
ncbi:hypothetical protein GCM10011378_41680 [Hymenobacter glacieicola]|uniref:Uncharacterized protein n=2 Tax=Hymenobacter glacieicola TaxID=1562124 RepID=A0ABQ1XA50_9BACT|nr:hypothetical protein GCM10011378_41680 [Hymenobacter glacieicola]